MQWRDLRLIRNIFLVVPIFSFEEFSDWPNILYKILVGSI